MENTSLTVLNVAINEIGDVGMTALASALCQHPALTTVDLSNNKLFERGFQAVAAIVKGNKSIRRLVVN